MIGRESQRELETRVLVDDLRRLVLGLARYGPTICTLTYKRVEADE